jgi:hypothetical protein
VHKRGEAGNERWPVDPAIKCARNYCEIASWDVLDMLRVEFLQKGMLSGKL